jgi:hypothetical protein
MEKTMMTKILAVLAVGFALGQWAAARQQHTLRNRLDNPRTKPDEVSNWEGEGGALPVTGAQLGPAPQQS